jgi:ribonuclease D
MKKEKAKKYGWGNGRFARSLTDAREKAARKIGRANLVVIENRGIVVVYREMLEDLMRVIRSRRDADLAVSAARSQLKALMARWS